MVAAARSRPDSQRSARSRIWPRGFIRAFGAINVVLSCAGVYLLAVELFIFVSGRHTHERYISQAYYAMTVINLVCLAAGLVAGIYLLRLRPHGLVICNFVFGFQIVYFLVITFLPLMLTSSPGASAVGDSIAAAGGIGNIGIGVEGTIVYPIVALAVLNLAYRRLKRPKQSCAE